MDQIVVWKVKNILVCIGQPYWLSFTLLESSVANQQEAARKAKQLLDDDMED